MKREKLSTLPLQSLKPDQVILSHSPVYLLLLFSFSWILIILYYFCSYIASSYCFLPVLIFFPNIQLFTFSSSFLFLFFSFSFYTSAHQSTHIFQSSETHRGIYVLGPALRYSPHWKFTLLSHYSSLSFYSFIGFLALTPAVRCHLYLEDLRKADFNPFHTDLLAQLSQPNQLQYQANLLKMKWTNKIWYTILKCFENFKITVYHYVDGVVDSVVAGILLVRKGLQRAILISPR
jgi:hypothetical protein